MSDRNVPRDRQSETHALSMGRVTGTGLPELLEYVFKVLGFHAHPMIVDLQFGYPVGVAYAGAQWSGFVLRRSSDFWNLSSGGFVLNGTTMAWHTNASPTITFAAPVRFDGGFIGSYGVAGPSTISYTLWLDGDQVMSSGPVGFSTGYLATGYAGPIDRIEFHVGANDRLSFDDLNVTAVPEPATWGVDDGRFARGGLASPFGLSVTLELAMPVA